MSFYLLSDDGSKITTTTPAPVTTVPTPPLTTTTAPITGIANFPTTPAPQGMLGDVKSTYILAAKCGAGVGECEKNPLWMTPNCCVSCRYHQAPKGYTLINNSCLAVLKDCKDTDTKCPSWAEFMTGMKNAQPGLRWMNVKNPTGPGWWIIVHEAVMFLFQNPRFAVEKTNGHYQAPTTCQAYIACSNGVHKSRGLSRGKEVRHG
ncbi:hypothetical protein OS493_001812 [Desmophyllum pertusum]|uniref:Uncharacterized protein n=1 Tax=Desmophyllum pertusum TaxID=174260 RepID=A0A9W9Z503_9CNID|nr:hypothetical protein OS493_001812 [Desmophyllum pertusum]